jgi:hypothetical protein
VSRVAVAIEIVALLSLTALSFAQTSVPKFEDFPAKEALTGKPAAPVFKRAKDKLFRTQIRDQSAAGPNFAGRFTIASWGCGTECVGGAMIDGKLGTILDLPFETITWAPGRFEDGAAWPSDKFEPIEFKPTSRLLIIHGSNGEKRDTCGVFYYEWTGSQFKLVKKLGYIPTRLP